MGEQLRGFSADLAVAVPVELAPDLAQAAQAGGFDAAWYLAEYPDVGMTGIEPLAHYLWIGRKLGRRGMPGAVAAVLTQAEGAECASADALAGVRMAPDGSGGGWAGVHLGTPQGEMNGKPGAGDLGADGACVSHAAQRDPAIDPAVYEAVAAGMSREFYLLRYPDIAEAGVDPVAHYLQAGWAEGRDPCRQFCTRHYLDNYPDVAAAGINPFYHWLVAGRAEGRHGRHQLGFRFDLLAAQKPVTEQIAEMKARRRPVALGNARHLSQRLAQMAADGGQVVLSFSHDDFTAHVGGVQLLLRRELGLLRAQGWHQIHVFPAHPLGFLECSGEVVLLGVVIDGEMAGFYRPLDLMAAARGLQLAQVPRLVIHNLLGHNVDQVLAIVAAFGVSSGHFWLHDYAALYNNYKLLRNDVAYAGRPDAGSMAQQLCLYAQAPFCHADEFSRLFDALALEVIAPSQAACAIWVAAGLHKAAGVRVLEHCALEGQMPGAQGARAADGPLRVGFLGYPAAHKGWEVFAELALRFGDDPRYEFHHLGKGRQGGLPVTYHEVVADAQNPDAMRAAVARTGLDVALVWSIWPETFCLTAYEGLAGGAALVSNPDAGNVARLIDQSGGANGRVLADEAALAEAFASGAILALARRGVARAEYGLAYSPLTTQFWFSGEGA